MNPYQGPRSTFIKSCRTTSVFLNVTDDPVDFLILGFFREAHHAGLFPLERQEL
jgi:hypothetical protein